MTPSTPTNPGAAAAARQWISDLADGRLAPEALPRCSADWSADPAARETWHTYHLIGDVLRSDELASRPAADAAFLIGVRQRLAGEPVVLAPAPRRAKRGVWWRPMVAAAGFVAVAGVVVVLQQADVGGPAAQLASTRAGVLPGADAAPRRVGGGMGVPPGEILRDARVDEYLRAHREVLAGSPAALPGGAMRNVDLAVSPR